MNETCRYDIEPFFLPFGQESIFCVFLVPREQKPRGGILYLPPFAEEMHKSRRMAALQARRFAQAGYAVLQVDLPGCGDSTGDFEDASWTLWLACGRMAHDWLRQKLAGVIVLWGLRLGATLAVELASQLADIAGLILWQPILNGENFINQFLRIRLASEILSGTTQKAGTRELLALLASGEAVEIGGYMLPPILASEISRLRLSQFAIHSPVFWFEVLATASEPPSPASARVIQAWVDAGVDVTVKLVPGKSFWDGVDIIECPELLTETTRVLDIISP